MHDEVRALMLHCLYAPEEVVGEEPPADAVIVVGLTRKYGLHPGRVAESRGKIAGLLRRLPDEFTQSRGGGWSLRDGDQWGEHRDMQDLMVLGIAAGFVEYLFPREIWHLLPGGVPYFVVKDGAQDGSN